MTKPYMYGKARFKSNGIYQVNLSFLTELNLRNIETSYVCKCNTVHREANYIISGCYILRKGT